MFYFCKKRCEVYYLTSILYNAMFKHDSSIKISNGEINISNCELKNHNENIIYDKLSDSSKINIII